MKNWHRKNGAWFLHTVINSTNSYQANQYEKWRNPLVSYCSFNLMYKKGTKGVPTELIKYPHLKTYIFKIKELQTNDHACVRLG